MSNKDLQVNSIGGMANVESSLLIAQDLLSKLSNEIDVLTERIDALVITVDVLTERVDVLEE